MSFLRLYCPALSADTGHSDGCAAANRGASSDGLRPAGADTPGSGVTAALCQCHYSSATEQSAWYTQDCCSQPIRVVFGSSPACFTVAWNAWFSAQCIVCWPQVSACRLVAVETYSWQLCFIPCFLKQVSYIWLCNIFWWNDKTTKSLDYISEKNLKRISSKYIPSVTITCFHF